MADDEMDFSVKENCEIGLLAHSLNKKPIEMIFLYRFLFYTVLYQANFP